MTAQSSTIILIDGFYSLRDIELVRVGLRLAFGKLCKGLCPLEDCRVGVGDQFLIIPLLFISYL